jgi:hypothetical protein
VTQWASQVVSADSLSEIFPRIACVVKKTAAGVGSGQQNYWFWIFQAEFFEVKSAVDSHTGGEVDGLKDQEEAQRENPAGK